MPLAPSMAHICCPANHRRPSLFSFLWILALPYLTTSAGRRANHSAPSRPHPALFFARRATTVRPVLHSPSPPGIAARLSSRLVCPCLFLRGRRSHPPPHFFARKRVIAGLRPAPTAYSHFVDEMLITLFFLWKKAYFSTPPYPSTSHLPQTHDKLSTDLCNLSTTYPPRTLFFRLALMPHFCYACGLPVV